jgi:Domain of unknown function (DUF4234)
MAESVSIPGSGGRAKIRHPWAVFFLAIITLGIYYLYWYYQANRELRDYGVGTSPFTSLLALFPGGILVIPPFVSWWRFFGRLREAEDRAGVANGADQWIGFILYIVAFFFLPFELVYAQQHLNRLWSSAAASPAAAEEPL